MKKTKGALFRHCTSFPIKGDDRNMARRLREVGNIVAGEMRRITKVTVTRERPLAERQVYRVRICGQVDSVARIRRMMKGRT